VLVVLVVEVHQQTLALELLEVLEVTTAEVQAVLEVTPTQDSLETLREMLETQITPALVEVAVVEVPLIVVAVFLQAALAVLVATVKF
jgi:hypothetical protein